MATRCRAVAGVGNGLVRGRNVQCIKHPTEQRDLPVLPPTKCRLVPPGSDYQAVRWHLGPGEISWCRRSLGLRGEVSASLDEGQQPGGLRSAFTGNEESYARLHVDEDHPVGRYERTKFLAQARESRTRWLLDNTRDEFEHRNPGFGEVSVEVMDLLDSSIIDLPNLGDQQADEVCTRKRYHQFVDGLAGTALEDVDTDHVAAHGPDPTRHLTKCTGPIWDPHADDVGLHAPEATDRLLCLDSELSNAR